MYDIIVVGGGHAGCEAALACAKIGAKTLLVTGNLNMLGSMPCNPSIGGPAKGIVVREIDALGGYMGKNADRCQIQMKMLNGSKGPAVRALRCQADKKLYPQEMRKHIETIDNLELKEALVEKLIINNKSVGGVILNTGEEILSKIVILTTGTYLNSRTLRGFDFKIEGPDNEPTTFGLSKQLKELGFTIQRLKTGTPPRIVKESIDFSKASVEAGDTYPWKFSFDKGYDQIENVNVDCHLIYTNTELHKLILDNLDKSSMYGGVIEGVGPRYCPSIETKIVRFKDKERHQIFLEPESLYIDEIYIGGFSTSMPIDIQDKMIRMLPGLENCKVKRYAYAIEYDAINPIELWPSLETKIIDGLFCAGQINGTSGYEEAACQGLMAGINACAKLNNKKPLVLRRDEAYIGVLIDDLVTKGTDEPYRLLTSRAEYRLLLRHDNADLRLREYGYEYGLISKEQIDLLHKKIDDIKKCKDIMNSIKYKCTEENNKYLESISSSPLFESVLYYDLIKRPEISFNNILEMLKNNNQLELFKDIDNLEEVLEEAEIEIKYKGYIDKAKQQALKMNSMDSKIIPDDIDYNDIHNLALEAREKLMAIKPKTIGQASRIMGVNPADIAVLLVYVDGKKVMDFKKELLNLNIDANEEILEKFNIYYEYLIEYNKKINLTAITEHDEVFIKHFYDSLILTKALPYGNIKLCDIGAGAGFPSIPCAICNDNIDVTIIDALNKRIIFLKELIKKLNITNVNPIHGRAEDYDKKEGFDVVTARAVARLNILSELCLPLVKIGGYFIALKSLDSHEELDEAKNAIKILGGEVSDIMSFNLPQNMGARDLIIIKKVKASPFKYPRHFNLIKTKPLK